MFFDIDITSRLICHVAYGPYGSQAAPDTLSKGIEMPQSMGKLGNSKAGAWQVALSLLVDFKDCDVKLNTVVYNAAILACRGPGWVVVRCCKVNNSDMRVA